MPRRRSLVTWLVVGLVLSASPRGRAVLDAHPQSPSPGPPKLAEAIDDALRAGYNLDYEGAAKIARTALAAHPDEPRAHRALASVLWLQILFARGAVTVDAYLGGITNAKKTLPPPPPALDAEFKKELGLAISLAEARVKKNRFDLDALYDQGAAYALQASYTASVEGSLMSAFGSARRAYNAHETVLDKLPSRADAAVVVGTYRYIVSGLSLPSRMFAYVAGFGGGKDKGITMLQAADREHGGHPEAAIALILIYAREGRHAAALPVVRGLAAEFPGNRFFTLETGATAIRAGLPAEADEMLSRGIAALEKDTRPRIPSEKAVWLYKRAVARRMLNRPAEALVDLTAAQAERPADWVRGRIHLELGKLADLTPDRPVALAEYTRARGLCEAAADTTCTTDAAKWLKRPFR